MNMLLSISKRTVNAYMYMYTLLTNRQYKPVYEHVVSEQSI